MNRVRFAFAATLVGALGIGGSTLFAQETKAPPPETKAPAPETKAPEFKSVLAGKKFTPPVRGSAEVDFLRSATRREGNLLVTKIQVKNMSPAPIPRLTIDEVWYDKNNEIIPGGKGVVAGLLQPGEIQTIVIETPFNAKMKANNYNFSHANGTIKPHKVPKMTDEKEPAAKPAAAKPAAKKK